VGCRARTIERFAVLAAIGLSVAGSALAGSPRCPGFAAEVPGWSEAERADVCSAATAAAAFLREAGFEYSDGLTIRQLSPEAAQQGGHVIGRFDASHNEIFVLPYDACVDASRTHAPAFGMPMSAALWRSFVVHEVAHAIAEQHFGRRARRQTASEYVAAVVQLSMLPPELRADILDRYDAEAFRDASEIGMLLYDMNPAVFAVSAYRHYVSLGDRGPAFLGWLLREGLDQ
jgi:hypothetical protein